MPDSSPSRDADTLQQLRRQYQEVSELAGALAHEIKNPLSVIGMNVELMAEELTDVELPQARRALIKLDIVQKQCHRLQRMLDDFLRFAKVRNLNLTPGSLNEQIDRVLNLFAPQAKELGVEIIRYLDPDLPSILLDEQTLEAALVNLVKNCLEATTAGDQLIARTRLTKSGVALDLIDTGRGMDQNTAIHMFDPFYSTKESGSGLGLPTARKGIEAHGGRIHVQSELGRGTKFSIEFPMPVRLHAGESES
jgi:signal transduction histidine kinase